MSRLKKAAFFLFVGMMPSFVLADAVSINANGGVIPNDATADVTIIAGGEGDGVTLAADTTTVNTLTDNTTATVKIGSGQTLSVDSHLSAVTSDSKLTVEGTGNATLSVGGNLKLDYNAHLNLSGVRLDSTDGITAGATDGRRAYISMTNAVVTKGNTSITAGELDIHDGTFYTNRFVAGSTYASIYQDGGKLVTLSYTTMKSYSYLCQGGYFYYLLSGGEWNQNEALRFGSNTSSGSKPAADAEYQSIVLEQTGGTLKAASMNFPQGRYQRATFVQKGGTFTSPGNALRMGGSDATGGPIGARSLWVIDGGAATSTWKYILACEAPDTRVNFAFNGGEFNYGALTHARAENSKCYVSFNGGTIKPDKDTSHSGGIFARSRYQTQRPDDYSNLVDRVTIYEGGATVNMTGVDLGFYEPLEAPEGGGVSGAAKLPTASTFFGPPTVEIIGDGYGAAAYAEYDRATKKVTGLKIASPGNNYTWAKAVYIRGRLQYNAHQAETQDCTVVSQQIGGGLTKIGANTLWLNATNTYAGATYVNEGTLRLGNAYAVPTNSPVYVAEGAYLDLYNSKTYLTMHGSLGSGGGAVKRGNVQIDGRLALRADDLLAGNKLTFTDGKVIFPVGATCTLDDVSKLQPGVDYELVATSAACEGDLPNVVGAEDCYLKYSADKKKIYLHKKGGMVIIFR